MNYEEFIKPAQNITKNENVAYKENVNPLAAFCRIPKLTCKLPTNGIWYEDGFCSEPYDSIKIYGMNAQDDLNLKNPDLLISGEASYSLIKSCVPSISDPKKLKNIDFNVLYLAIQIATIGEKSKIETYCSKCQEKYNKFLVDNKLVGKDISLYNESELKLKEEFDKTCNVEKRKFTLFLNDVLDRISYVEEDDYILKLENGLTIILTPHTIKDSLEIADLEFKRARMFKELEKLGIVDLDDIPAEQQKVRKQLESDTEKMYLLQITRGINSVILPDGTEVSDKNMISEYVANTEYSQVKQIVEKITTLNNIGVPTNCYMHCPICGEDFEHPFNVVDPTNFLD